MRIIRTSGLRANPPGQAIRDIGHITRRRTSMLGEIAALRNVATVVAPHRLVRIAIRIQIVHQPPPVLRALCSILDHLKDGQATVFRIVRVAIVRLHQAWIPRSAGRCSGWVQRAAVGLLDDGCENDAVIDERSVGAVLDGVVDVLNHLGGVVVAVFEPTAGVLEGV